jgi:hypothetical protein
MDTTPQTIASRPMRLVLLVLAGVTSFWIAYGFAPPSASADSTCDSSNFCVWTGVDFTGAKQQRDCSVLNTGYGFDNLKYSLKNKCGNKAITYGYADGHGSLSWTGCLNPDGIRSWTGAFNRVTTFGSSC